MTKEALLRVGTTKYPLSTPDPQKKVLVSEGVTVDGEGSADLIDPYMCGSTLFTWWTFLHLFDVIYNSIS